MPESGPDWSIARAVSEELDPGTLSPAERADLAFYLEGTYGSEWGLAPDRISARTADQGKYFHGNDVLFPEGYSRLLDPLAPGLPLSLGTPVSAVAATGSGVSVSTGGGELRAEAAVVTVPLGVLKAAAGSKAAIRIDGLSRPAREAIDTIEMGVLSKTFLHFDDVYWPADVDWHGYLGPEGGPWSQWLSLAKLSVPVLLGFNSDQYARSVEAMRPEQIIDAALPALRDMFGAKLPRPVAVLNSAWSTDPWALGSYSANSVGVTRKLRAALTEPVAERIFLAGEATEPDYHSTVHGALLSGRRAAEQVLEVLA